MSEPARKEVAKRDEAPAPILSTLQRIMTDPSVSMERVNQTWDFYQRVQKDEARKAYFEAKAAFKASPLDIFKDKRNKQYDSAYASIGNVVNIANAELSKYGLDASWDFDQTNGIKVTCTLRHALGHAESVSLSGPPDSSGSKNPLQQIKSTLTYLKLATFEGVTGIATKEGNLDDDGNGSGLHKETISAEQLDELQAGLKQTKSNVPKFCAHFKIETIGALPASRFQEAMGLVDAKKKAAGI